MQFDIIVSIWLWRILTCDLMDLRKHLSNADDARCAFSIKTFRWPKLPDGSDAIPVRLCDGGTLAVNSATRA
jgi:hypothetical protein